METQWVWANTPIGSKSLASPEADRRSWMQWHASFQALTPHSAAPTPKPCGTALTLLTMEWTPSTARFGWACSYSCDEGSKASFSTQPHWLFQQTIMNHTLTQEKTSKASFHLHLLLSQKTFFSLQAFKENHLKRADTPQWWWNCLFCGNASIASTPSIIPNKLLTETLI